MRRFIFDLSGSACIALFFYGAWSFLVDVSSLYKGASFSISKSSHMGTMMNSAEFKRQAVIAMVAAMNDAEVLGAGFIRILSNGTIERLDPKGIWLDPESEYEQDKQERE